MIGGQKFCFRHSTGEDIYLFTLRNAKGTEVCVSNYGTILTAFKIKLANGLFNDIVLGFEKMEEYFSDYYLKNYPYFGAACGRYANRIKNGRFSINGTTYQVTQNAGTDQLHGGFEGFDKKVWQPQNYNESFLELTYFSADGEEGYPGNLQTTFRIYLNDEDELSYEFYALTDQPTPVNLTHHSYFNLNNGKGTIDDHEVRIYASAVLQQDEGRVCNGLIMPVADTIYDFRNFTYLKKSGNPAIGYDQCFVIDKPAGLSLVAETRSLLSGLTLQIFSTEPAVQFYTAQGLSCLPGKYGQPYGPFSGLCLETHKHPNAVNIPHFPNTILQPGEIYFQKTVYKIIQDEK